MDHSSNFRTKKLTNIKRDFYLILGVFLATLFFDEKFISAYNGILIILDTCIEFQVGRNRGSWKN